MLNSAALASVLLHVSRHSRCYLVSISKKMMPNSWYYRILRMVLLEQEDLQKRFQKYLQDSTFSRVDWERGTVQSCSLSLDHRNLSHHSRNSPCPVVLDTETETKADSHKVHRFCIVWCYPLAYRKFFVILELIVNLLNGFSW